ncbi:D-alanyl-D-alanine carboxypeptidase family protein [Virgibacillus ndiopensis]|uniref:D-alanyl-D-alanine carboxypeptidase family protein n=1 Tax=Virgibacillus ndiopensis TaxID=2004408 RepID=UPI00159BE2CC|nr:D-alanyl-D-alanine carboxypeptidase family protein [Virgibacillus ndiopensis]
MFRRSLPVIIAMIMGIFVMSACTNEQQTTNGKTIDKESQANKSNDQKEHKSDLVLPDTNLKINAKGNDVKLLKKVLIKLGYAIAENGTFDANTEWAIKDFQAQQVKLAATGVYDKSTRKWIEKALNGSFKIEPGKGIAKDKATVKESDTITVSNPTDTLVLVNKQHALPEDYVPEELIVPDVPFPFTKDIPKKYMRKEAAKALEKMFAAAGKADLELYAQSGYRSYNRQQTLFASYSEQHGEKEANKFSARPGESEHQTGLTMDVTSPDIEFQLNTEFGKTDEGKWVKENAHKFGFIIRYPKGKEDITEYQYEPWHLRYVGKEAAQVIYEQELTLEEYLGVLKV